MKFRKKVLLNQWSKLKVNELIVHVYINKNVDINFIITTNFWNDLHQVPSKSKDCNIQLSGTSIW